MNEEEQQPIRIDLGSGNTKATGWIGIDKYRSSSIVDMVQDLDDPNLVLNFKDNSVTQMRASHFLEHITNLTPLMNECWRVLKPEATFDIIVPLFPSRAAMDDPTHKRFFTKGTFSYFTSNPPGNYLNPEIKGFWKILKNDWSPTVIEESDRLIYPDNRELHVILTPFGKEAIVENFDNNTLVETTKKSQ